MAHTFAAPTRRPNADAAEGDPPIVSRLDCERLAPHLGEPATFARAHLRRLLERALVVEPGSMPGDVVTMRSRVLLRDPAHGELDHLRLCYPGDAPEGEDDMLLVTSPLGAALLAARPGDTIAYPGARARRILILESLTFQPEQEGRLEL